MPRLLWDVSAHSHIDLTMCVRTIALTFVGVEKHGLTSTSVPIHRVQCCLFVPTGWGIVFYGWRHGETAMGFGDSQESCSFKCEKNSVKTPVMRQCYKERYICVSRHRTLTCAASQLMVARPTFSIERVCYIAAEM